MNRTAKAWLLISILAIILLSFLLPYTVFRDVDEWYGGFLFWSVASAVVIVLNAVVSADWTD